jgi:hypothetical protein
LVVLVFLSSGFSCADRFLIPAVSSSDYLLQTQKTLLAEKVFLIMRVLFIALALAATTTASPFAWAEPQIGDLATTAIAPTATKNSSHHRGNATGTGHHNPHKEPTPTFKLGCNCEKPIVPVDQLTPAEVSGGAYLWKRRRRRRGTKSGDWGLQVSRNKT